LAHISKFFDEPPSKFTLVDHDLRCDELLRNLVEGRMVGKPTKGRRRMNKGYEALKKTTEDWSTWRRSSTKTKVCSRVLKKNK